MLKRFQNTAGKKRLITALKEQKIIQGDETIAKTIADIAKLKKIRKGKKLIHQGRADADIYFIVSGNLSIIINGREIAKRTSGSHVGEMALIDPAAKRSATIKAIEDTVVAKVTEPSFTKLTEKYPHLWRKLAIELANRLREREKFIKQPNDKPLVFIASSSEYLPFAKAIQQKIKSNTISAKIWTDGVFEASATAIESLASMMETFDFGIVILGPDDLVESRGNKKLAPRDNVIFELGLMMGAFGRNRTFIVKPRAIDIKIPSDLLGITCLEFDNTAISKTKLAVTKASNYLCKKISSLGSK